MRTRLCAAVVLTAGAVLVGPGSSRASAATITFSGSGLSGLDYRPEGETAAYVPGSPDVAHLYTSDSGLSGGAPVVYVNGTIAGFPLGPLGSFSASYSLYSSSTPSGTAPYFLTYLNDPLGGYIGVVSFGGPTLDGASQIHVFYNFATSSCGDHWGDTLATLDSATCGATTFGKMTVYETGVEIGDWNNGTSTIPAFADIQSITVSSVPEPASLLLLGSGLAGAVIRLRSKRGG
jgi:PEP-CTERM motif